MHIEEKFDFSDVLIKPKRSNVSSRSQVDLIYNNCNEDFGKAIPIIAANMDGVGCFSVAKALAKYNMMTCLIKHYSVEEYIDFYNTLNSKVAKLIFFSLGANEKDLEKLSKVSKKVFLPNICLDLANAYTPVVGEYLNKIRKISPKSLLMVGNIATPEIIEDLSKFDVSYIKVGIGSGSVCTTRIKTGVGIPQLSCIADCLSEANRLGIKICSDGGVTCPGDVVKAFGAGASMVMVGGLFAGCDECEGDWEYELEPGEDQDGNYEWVEGKKVALNFYGMSSQKAMEKYSGGVAEYRASEGKSAKVLYKGPIKDTVQDILGGLRSACSYVGAFTLKDLHPNTTFVKVYRTHNQVFGK